MCMALQIMWHQDLYCLILSHVSHESHVSYKSHVSHSKIGEHTQKRNMLGILTLECYIVGIVRQVPNSTETNLLDLGF